MRRDIDAGEDSATLQVRELLRRETAAAHRAVELLPRMRRLLQPDVTREDYAVVLDAFLPVHEDFEPAVARCAQWEPGSAYARARALRDDIAELGIPVPPRSVPAAPRPQDPATALGACYVLEGSFLGGVVIAAHLRRCLGEDLPLRYFSATGIDSTRRWRDFLARAEADLTSDAQRAAALHGARDAYRWLHGVLP